jgi:hypothetical protein
MSSPIKHIENLLLCLSDNKRPIGFLLGAGCPFSIKTDEGGIQKPLIPNIEGLTEYVATMITGDEIRKSYAEICAQLKGIQGLSPNIERVLSQVRDLKNIVSKGASVGISGDCLRTLEEEICNRINECVQESLPNQNTPYHHLADWIKSAERDKPVEVFTTNYDLLAEQALEEMRVPFFDGFPGSRRPFFDPYAIEQDEFPSRWARVWKLHGSINWRCIEEEGNTVCRTLDDSRGTLTIHPSHMKYDQSRKMPYLAMMDRLKMFITSPESILFIIGYSFGDEHLNDIIVHNLHSSSKSAVFALMYGHISSPDVQIAANLASSRGNLSIFAADGAVIGKKTLLWKNQHQPSGITLPIEAFEWNQVGDDKQYGDITVKIGDFVVFGDVLRVISGRGMV